jgi:carboxypeptidase Taq
MTAYEQLVEHTRQTALLVNTLSVIEWDERTKLPKKGGDYRAEQSAFLAGLIHRRNTAPEVGDWLAAAEEAATDDQMVVLRELRRTYDRKTKLPQKLVEAITRAASLGQQVWAEARRDNDFERFAPRLAELIKLKREEAAAVGTGDCAYDALLDDYEPHETTERVASVLADLRDQLVPLVAQITESRRCAPVEILSRDYPVAAQEEFGKVAARAIGFDFDAGRLDVTDHPFCSTSGPYDVRLTTRYQANFFNSGFYSILHEAGHGLYEQGLPAQHFGLPTGEAVSLGIHESQSRWWENLVGRSHAFWEHMYPAAQQAFPQALANVKLDDFYFAVNESKPSLIRVEADEATYNLHILIRFELEQAIIEGDLDVNDLPAAWNGRYREYLGIEPPDDKDGVMQDVHWSAGLFGYFPTYALGNLYASQFFEACQRDLGNLDELMRRGEFLPILQWLQTNIHAHGQRYRAAELVQKVTGQPLSSAPLLRHLKAKFGALYDFA